FEPASAIAERVPRVPAGPTRWWNRLTIAIISGYGQNLPLSQKFAKKVFKGQILKPKAPDSEPGTRNPELETRNPELETPTTVRKTPRAEHDTRFHCRLEADFAENADIFDLF